MRCSELGPSPSQVGNGTAYRSLARMNPKKGILPELGMQPNYCVSLPRNGVAVKGVISFSPAPSRPLRAGYPASQASQGKRPRPSPRRLLCWSYVCRQSDPFNTRGWRGHSTLAQRAPEALAHEALLRLLGLPDLEDNPTSGLGTSGVEQKS